MTSERASLVGEGTWNVAKRPRTTTVTEGEQNLVEFLRQHVVQDQLRQAFEARFATELPIELLRKQVLAWHERYLKTAEAFETEARDRRVEYAARIEVLEAAWAADLERLRTSLSKLDEMKHACDALKGELEAIREVAGAVRSDGSRLASQVEWRERFTYLLAFLPDLPNKVRHDELRLLLGGANLPAYEMPYRPPRPATIDAKRVQFLALPEAERLFITDLCILFHRHHQVAVHPPIRPLLGL